MTRAALGALLSHWRRRPLQLATLLIGLALATALWSGVQAINAEARASYDRAAGAVGQAELTELRGPGLDVATYAALRRAGWDVSPVIEGPLVAGGHEVRLRGVDPITAPLDTDIPRLGDEEAAGFIGGDGLIFAPPELVADLEAVPGLPEVRVSPNLGPGEALTDISVAARLLGRGNAIDYLRVLPDQRAGLPPIEAVAPGLTASAPAGESDIARLTDSFHLNLTAFGFLAFAVGLFIVHASVGLAFEQRRGVFRTLRALGVPAGRLMGLLLGELVALALLAGAAGVALGYVIAAILLPGVALTLGGLYGAEVAGTLTLRPGWALAGLGIAVAGTLLAGAQALWRLWRMPILAAAQPRAWARASARTLRWQGMAAAALLALAAILTAVGGSLAAGFGALAALLLGAALALPLVLSAALGLGERLARGVIPEWFLADTRQQLPGLGLALMALLLALSANIGVGTMVSSFRLTFTGWLDQRLASELYVTARSPEEAGRLVAFLEGRVDRILPIYSVEARIGGLPAEIYGIVDDPTYTENWPLLSAAPGVWDRLAAQEGALLNEQAARRMGVSVGDVIELEPGWDAPVLGIYSDYGNPAGQALIAAAALDARHPEATPLRFGLRLPEGEVPALIGAITDDFGLQRENMIDQASVKRLSLDVFEQTFTVTGALNVLTLGVAGFAMLTSLLTLAAMRLPQLAPVWAMGLTRGRLARLELVRSLVLAALTAVLALPVGLALAWLLLAVINVEAFGWRLPMHVFPLDWLRLGALAMLAALLAAAWPARRLARMPPRELLGVFSHER